MRDSVLDPRVCARGSAEQVADPERDVGKGLDGEDPGTRDAMNAAVAVGAWRPVDMHRFGLEVHDPSLADAGLTVQQHGQSGMGA